MKNFIFALAITLVSFTAFAQHPEDSQAQPAKLDTGYCELYLVLNDVDAYDYSFNLYLNNEQIIKINNGTRMTYKIHSRGKVMISDKGHKPFFEFQAKPGAKFYFEIDKKFGGRFFHLHNYSTESEIQNYLHFIFWNRNINGTTGGGILDNKTKDYIKNINMGEAIDSHICK